MLTKSEKLNYSVKDIAKIVGESESKNLWMGLIFL